MAELTPQPESPLSQIQRWIEQDASPSPDVSTDTSGNPETDPEQGAASAALDDAAKPDGSEPDSEAGEPEESEAPEIRTLGDLAQRLEMDEEGLALHLRIQGRDGEEVSLQEVIAAYRQPAPEAQEIERTRARVRELESKEQDWHSAAEELRQSAQQFAQQLRQSQPDWGSPQMQELKRTDPARFSMLRLDWIEQQNQLRAAAEQLEQHHAKAQAEHQRQVQEARQVEARKLKASRPEWADQRVFERDIDRTAQYLMKSWSLSGEDIGQLADHRDWSIAYRAMLYDELQARKPEALKRVRSLPKMVIPGAATPAEDRGAAAQARKAEDSALARLKESGSSKDAVDAIAARLARSERSAAGRQLARQRRV